MKRWNAPRDKGNRQNGFKEARDVFNTTVMLPVTVGISLCASPPDIFADFDMSIEPDVMSSDVSDYTHLFADDDTNDVYDLCPQTKDKDTPVSTPGLKCVSHV